MRGLVRKHTCVQYGFFAVESFPRLEAFIVDCDAYEHMLSDQFMVLMSYNGLFVYMFLLITAVYDRTLFHVMAWCGIVLTECLSTATEALLWETQQTYSDCNPHSVRVPCRGVALVTFCITYYLLYRIVAGDKSFVYVVMQFGGQCVFLFLTGLSFVWLHLADALELVMGFMVGVLSGVLMSVLLMGYCERMRERKCMEVCHRIMCLPR